MDWERRTSSIAIPRSFPGDRRLNSTETESWSMTKNISSDQTCTYWLAATINNIFAQQSLFNGKLQTLNGAPQQSSCTFFNHFRSTEPFIKQFRSTEPFKRLGHRKTAKPRNNMWWKAAVLRGQETWAHNLSKQINIGIKKFKLILSLLSIFDLLKLHSSLTRRINLFARVPKTKQQVYHIHWVETV